MAITFKWKNYKLIYELINSMSGVFGKELIHYFNCLIKLQKHHWLK